MKSTNTSDEHRSDPNPTTKKGNSLMRFNPFKPTPNPEPVLLAVTPPRTGERTLLGVENLLGSIAVPEPFSLELTGDASGVTLMARCLDGQGVRRQLAAHYPQAGIHDVPRDDDPLRLAAGEQAWAMTLRPGGPEYVPLRVFADDDLLDPGSDPILALLGALGPDWSRQHQQRAHEPALPQRTDSYQISESRRHRVELTGAAALALGAVAFFQGYQWWQAGEQWKAVALGAGVALTLGVAGWAWARWQASRNRVFDPRLI